MADIDEDGWHHVLAQPANETREEKQIEEWESSKGHWSGLGKHPDGWTDHKSIKTYGRELGIGSYGIVERITYRTVTMARKCVKPRRGMTVEQLREEANAMERLVHKHILKLVGTYTFKLNSLYLLLYPAAVCDLSKLLEDVDDIRSGSASDEEDAFTRLRALGLREVGTIKDLALLRNSSQTTNGYSRATTALGFLQQILGCITEALAYCHEKKIRHRDLKPKNILLSPGRVYLADFGIARDLKDREDSITSGRCGTPSWIAPEVHDEELHSMSHADIWSLGCIFLNVATMLYGGTLEQFDDIMKEKDWKLKYGKLPSFLQDLQTKAVAASLENPELPNFNCKHVLSLIDQMLRYDPGDRPDAKGVKERLVELGGLDQIYHLPCCHMKNYQISQVINKKFKCVYAEKINSAALLSQMKAEVEANRKRIEELESINGTWQQRLDKERKHAGEQYKALQENHNREMEARKQLEIQLQALQKPLRRPGSQTRGRGRGLANGIDFYASTGGNITNNKNNFHTIKPPPGRNVNTLQRRYNSRVPVPTRPATPIISIPLPNPSTPIQPMMNRDPISTSSTLRSSVYSTISKTSLRTDDSMSSLSSEPNRSMSPDSPTTGRDDSASIAIVAPVPALVLVKAKPDMETLKLVEIEKTSWAKMVARSTSKV
ncbi:related to cyclin-dependent ser/thr protein kinase KIN28 [Rhynchosporium secalis]|uniref:non-specific serine/threonine protein kinase n=1 Tax=Rhynchosporium secalis TaxID=38038 RepID=A0A1E1M9R5_RHYSE|nr:related to cyclin-dependent ser/thr protein kinase KIN28 [Rhynchosporium secalis]